MDTLFAFVCSLLPMSAADLALLAPLATVRTVPKGGYLLEPGQVCEWVFFARAGLLRFYYVDAEGQEVNCRFAAAPAFLTDFQSFLAQQPSRYYWQALEASEVLAFRHADVQRLYHTSAVWERFGRLMAEHVYQQVNERIELLQFLTPTQRYEHLRATQPALLARVAQFQLASYLGIKPESLSRIRRRLGQQRA